ncbi:MAG: tetratricopeptide repeat protein [Bradymonadaceae bacterium]
MRRLTFAVFVSLFVALATGCATVEEKGHRAFEKGNYKEALGYYQRVIEEGTRNWRVYYRAAKSAENEGNFATAEKYYARAYRHGGGTKVVRSFAKFYVRTSNYTRAVRLYQYLLNTDVEKQSVYNNLGAALMYANSALDAESYLLIAQQMDPTDPVPYANLGVLYERHLNKPYRAIGFYRCYLKMAGSGGRASKISRRVSELERRYGQRASRANVECGKPFRPRAGARAATSGSAGATGAKGPIELKLGSPGGDGDGSDAETDGSKSGSSDETGGEATDETSPEEGSSSSADGADEEKSFEIVVAGKGETGSAASQSGPASADESGPGGKEEGGGAPASKGGTETSDREAVLRRARRAWKVDNYQQVVDAISQLSLSSLGVDSMRMYGLSLAELGRNEKAAQWLEWTVRRKPDPTVVEKLIDVYRRLGRRRDLKGLCRKFDGRSSYAEVLKSCPESEKSVDEKQEALEEYREKLKKKGN